MNTNRPAYVIVFTAMITAGFTAAVMTVQEMAKDKIAANEAGRFGKALVDVFGLGEAENLNGRQVAEIIERRIEFGFTATDPQTGREFEVIRAYGREIGGTAGLRDSDVVGVAFRIEGKGFWAPISGVMALSPDLKQIKGIVFLDHKETPGLGGRISEQWFVEQFAGLDISGEIDGAKYVYVSKDKPSDAGDPKYGRTVEAITGATQTSMAVERLVNENLAQFRRAMQAGLKQPTEAEGNK